MPVVPVNHFSSANDSNVVCRSLAKVLYSERMIPAPILEGKFGLFDVNISPQLPFGRLIRTSYEPDRSKPQHPSDQTEKPFSGSDTERNVISEAPWKVSCCCGLLSTLTRASLR